MTRAEQSDKLALIRTLTRGEIEGWRSAIGPKGFRPALDGEQAALMAREKQLTQEGR